MYPQNQVAFHRLESQRRQIDPIESTYEAYPEEIARVGALALRGTELVGDVLAHDNRVTPLEKTRLYEEGCDDWLDLVYAKNEDTTISQTEFVATYDKASGFFKDAMRDAAEHKGKNPEHYWTVAMKALDLRASTAYRNARESQTTLAGTQAGQKVWGLAENQVKGVLVDSLGVMNDMLRHAQDPEIGRRVRGKLYEHVMISYARLQTFQEQTFDTTFVRSALIREDEPRNGYVTPKRSFDMVVEKAGEYPRLLQLKNHDNNTEYADPIEKVKTTSFGRILDNLPQYVRDYQLVLSNPSDPNLKQKVDAAASRLDSVFGSQLLQTT